MEGAYFYAFCPYCSRIDAAMHKLASMLRQPSNLIQGVLPDALPKGVLPDALPTDVVVKGGSAGGSISCLDDHDVIVRAYAIASVLRLKKHRHRVGKERLAELFDFKNHTHSSRDVRKACLKAMQAIGMLGAHGHQFADVLAINLRTWAW